MTIEEQMDAAFRIRRAVCAISEKSPSHARSVIDQFLKFIAPSMARDGATEFPVTCRRCAPLAENAAYGAGRWPTLYFHIGNAILGLYDGVRGIHHPGIESRIALLESIAKLGMDSFRVRGDDREGYYLKEASSELPNIESVQGELHDAGGSTGVSVPGSPLLLRP